MAFLSQIVGKPVYDSQQHKVGLIEDVCVPAHQVSYPQVSAVKVGQHWIPWSQFNDLDGRASLKVSQDAIREHTVRSDEVRLRDEVLDHQVVDIEGHKVRRVSDLALSRTNGHYSLVGVDLSTRALFRRLGLGAVLDKLGLRTEELIPWKDVDPVASDRVTGVRLRRSREAISRLHPSDLADIVEDLTVAEGLRMLDNLDDGDAADVLEEVEQERQADLLEQMDAARAADILEEMDPDDAADVLGDMDPERATEVMSLMEAEEYQEVAELLGYAEDTAGGIMTTDYVAASQDMTAQAVIDHIRNSCRDTEMVYTIYALRSPDSEELVGAVTLRDLIMASPKAKLSEIMQPDPVRVCLEDHQNEVAKVIAKYNLVSVPVVNDKDELQGIVTVDDAVDVLLPTAWKKRLPRMF